MRVLDGEIMKPELILHLSQEGFLRLVQADPDELVRFAPTSR